MDKYRNFKAFRWFTLALVMVWSLANVVHVSRKVTRRNPLEDPGVIASYDARFRLIREEILGMDGLKQIGFVSDLQPNEVLYDFAAAKDYFLTQYALAPIVLTLGLEKPEYAIGSFSSTALEHRVLPGFEAVRDWAMGSSSSRGWTKWFR